MVKLFWLVPLCFILMGPIPSSARFEMRVFDDATGIPVANLRVTTDSRIVCHTIGTGACLWWPSSLMNRDVRITIQDDEKRFDTLSATIRVTPGGQAELRVRRRT